MNRSVAHRIIVVASIVPAVCLAGVRGFARLPIHCNTVEHSAHGEGTPRAIDAEHLWSYETDG